VRGVAFSAEGSTADSARQVVVRWRTVPRFVIRRSSSLGVVDDPDETNGDMMVEQDHPSSGRRTEVPLGAPVYVQALRYTAMYGAKPFPEALLVYLDNGAYKILSPGEEHFGSYVSATDPAAAPRHVAFVSWPSEDWGRNVASHTLTFDPDTGAFVQSLVLPGDPVPRAQHGYAAGVDEPVEALMDRSWDDLRTACASVFDRLHERAARGRDDR